MFDFLAFVDTTAAVAAGYQMLQFSLFLHFIPIGP